jgi:hypothetical protein
MQRGHLARALGRLLLASAVGVLLTTVALELLPGIVGMVGVIVTALLLVLAALAGVSLAMPPALLQLDDTGFRAFKKQVAGPSQGRWEAVQSVSTQAGEHGPVMFIVHTAGVHTAVPLALLDARAETVEADVRRRLDQAHGYRRLT